MTLEKIGFYHIGLAVLGLVAALVIHEYYNEMSYRRAAHKRGVLTPAYIHSDWLAIPRMYRFIQAFIHGTLNQFCRDRITEFGKRTFRVQTLSRTMFATIEPENVKAILATQFKDFDLGHRYLQWKPMMGDGVFTLSGSGWQHSRALLRPQFTTEEISRLNDIEQEVQVLLKLVRDRSLGIDKNEVQSDGTFDLQELFFRFTLDTATEFLFGQSTDILSGGSRTSKERYKLALEFADEFNVGQSWLLVRGMAQKLYGLIQVPSFYRAANVCKKFIDFYVEDALKLADTPDEKLGEHSKYYFLRELTKETRDPVLMRDQALNILLAGRDTTAGTLSFTFALLLRNPKVYEKLRTAVLEDFGTGVEGITFQSLKRCEYLKWVINEVLRLYPIVPLNFRQATRDTTLPRGGGEDESKPIYVPKGQIVFYTTYAMQRDKGIWGPDAEEFLPDRWADKTAGSSWKYIPFNGGPRICLGQQFALTEVAYTIVRLVQNFEALSAPQWRIDQPIRELSTLTISSFDGVYLKMKPAEV